MSDRYDVLILGAGTAGLSALRAVRQRTDSFAIVNSGPYGTMCARVGCMPSKALIEAANGFHQRCRLAAMGIRGSDALSVDMPAVMRHVRELRDRFVRNVLKMTDTLGERSICGRASFVDADVVEVDGRRLQAKRIVIATGSHPIVPEEWRPLNGSVLTTDELFEQTNLPRRMAVIGLGGVGAETAQALSRLGVEVIAFEEAGEIAGLSDPVVNRHAIAALREEFEVVLGSKAQLERTDGGICVSAGNRSVVVNKVLAALGRRPNLAGLGLERFGVALDERGVPSFDRRTMQVGDLPIYIAGDANADVPLLHEASDEGFIAGYNAVRQDGECFERRTPLSIFFTSPNIAIAGHSFAEIQAMDAVVGAADLEQQGRLQLGERSGGCLRVYAQRGDGRILGAEICAPEGEHLAHLIAFAIQRELTVREFLRLPIYHPVVEEALRTAMRDAAERFNEERTPDLALCDRLPAASLE